MVTVSIHHLQNNYLKLNTILTFTFCRKDYWKDQMLGSSTVKLSPATQFEIILLSSLLEHISSTPAQPLLQIHKSPVIFQVFSHLVYGEMKHRLPATLSEYVGHSKSTFVVLLSKVTAGTQQSNHNWQPRQELWQHIISIFVIAPSLRFVALNGIVILSIFKTDFFWYFLASWLFSP